MYAGLVTGITFALFLLAVKALFFFADSGYRDAAQGGPIECQTGADCVYQRYVDADRDGELAAAGHHRRRSVHLVLLERTVPGRADPDRAHDGRRPGRRRALRGHAAEGDRGIQCPGGCGMIDRRIYRETFDEDAGGWWGWNDNARGYRPLERLPSAVATRSPWWIDYNHAPPGAGYLHMLMGLNTAGPQGEAVREAAGPNRYIEGGFPTDLRGAEFSLALRWRVRSDGAPTWCLLAQATVEGITSGWALTGQPFDVSPVAFHAVGATLTVDPDQWTALGSRRGREDMYGENRSSRCSPTST